MKPKSMLVPRRQRTMRPVVLVLRKSVHIMKNAKNAPNITKRKTNGHTVQDNLFWFSEPSILLSKVPADLLIRLLLR